MKRQFGTVFSSLEESWCALLRKKAHEEQRSSSKVIRDAIIAYLSKGKSMTIEQAVEAIKDAIGEEAAEIASAMAEEFPDLILDLGAACAEHIARAEG